MTCDTAAEAVALGDKARSDGADLVKYHRNGKPIESWEEMEGYLAEEAAAS